MKGMNDVVSLVLKINALVMVITTLLQNDVVSLVLKINALVMVITTVSTIIQRFALSSVLRTVQGGSTMTTGWTTLSMNVTGLQEMDLKCTSLLTLIQNFPVIPNTAKRSL